MCIGNRIIRNSVLTGGAVVLVFLGFSSDAFATATVITTASGGSAISADTTGGTYTTLTAPVIDETDVAGLGTGAYTITAPAGFEFNTAANSVTISIGVSAGSTKTSNQINLGAGNGVSVTVTPAAGTISFSVTGTSGANTRNTLTFTGIKVRPTAPGCQVSTGDIIIAGVTSFTSNVIGTLTEVAGASARMYTVLPGQSYDAAACAPTGTPADQGAGVPFTLTALVVTDQFGNIDTGYTNTGVAITYSYTGPGATSFTETVDFSAGMSTTTLTTTLDSAATGVTITATTGSLTGIPGSTFNVIAGVVPVDHYAVSYPNGATGTACNLPVVEITAHAGDDSILDVPAGTVLDFSTSTGLGIWGPAGPAPLSGTGTWTPSGNDDGLASYSWPGGESSMQVQLSHSTATVNINLDDGVATDRGDGGVEDPDVIFTTDPIIRITTDGTAADSIAAQIAGKDSDQSPGAQTLYIQLKQSGVTFGNQDGCETPDAYSGTATVSVALECIDPATCSSNQVSVNGIPITASYTGGAVPDPFTSADGTGVSFTFDGGGTATDDNKAPLVVNYPDAGQVALHFTVTMDPFGGNNPARTFTGMSNNFVVKPAGLCVETTDMNSDCSSGDSTCTAFTKAGADFNLNIKAVGWETAGETDTDFCSGNNPDPALNFQLDNITLSATLIEPAGGNPGVLGVNSIDMTSGDQGEHIISNENLSEVGVFTVTATPPAYFGETIAPSTSATIGRFTPDHFTLLSPVITNRSTISCPAPSTFTYMDEILTVDYNLQARNAFDAVTLNYTGAFAKLPVDTASLGYGAVDTGTPTPLSTRLTVTSTIGTWNNGVAGISSNMGLDRDPMIEDGPYPQLAIGINPVEPDSVPMDVLDLDTDNIAGVDHASLGMTEIRYGRLYIGSGIGSELLPVAVPLEVQYYNGTAFVANDQDNCTNFDVTGDSKPDLILSNNVDATPQTDGDILICATGTSTMTMLNNPVAAGVGNLSFSAPGSKCVGYADISMDLGPGTPPVQNKPWLQYNWDGDAMNVPDNPSGRVDFGIFRGYRQLIYTREPWN